MNDNNNVLTENIIKNMSEGVMTIGFDGTIGLINPAGLKILGLKEKEIRDKKFATLFIDDEENDEFVQTILETVYDREKTHSSIVPFRKGKKTVQLRVVTSFLSEDDSKIGVILVFSDLSELMELRDSVKAMKKIKKLNDQLEMRNKLIEETFGRFLSDDIVKQLLNTPDGLKLGGKKADLTILMSDIRGFTAMSERLKAEDLISMLNHYLGEMTEVIVRHGGTVIEFLGDGILAVFGAPVWSKDHAGDAVAAALDMQTEMENVNIWNIKMGYPYLEMGIGINTGEVILGNIGSEKTMKYGVIGRHVNLCARIESYSVGGQVLISADTRNTIGAGLDIEKEMTVYPKGVNGEIVITQVTGIGKPYDIRLKAKKSTMHQLDESIPVKVHLIEGKHEYAKAFYGGITAVAEDSALLEADKEIELYHNIQIDAGGKLFCKVTGRSGSEYTLQYTSVPSGYAAWLRTYM